MSFTDPKQSSAATACPLHPLVELSETGDFSVLKLKEPTLAAPSIVFSARGDTCFGASKCLHVPGSGGGLLYGHMDNAAGVFALMKAFFSGRLPSDRVHCKVTYGEEKPINGVYFAGAREVMGSLSPDDFVAVIDVTGACSRPVTPQTVEHANRQVGHVVIEKVKRNEKVLQLLSRLKGRCTHISGIPVSGESDGAESAPYTYEIYHHCCDPQAFEDETDAYCETQTNTVFLGVPTTGGGGCGPAVRRGLQRGAGLLLAEGHRRRHRGGDRALECISISGVPAYLSAINGPISVMSLVPHHLSQAM